MKDIAAKKIIEKQRRFHISGLVQVWFKSGWWGKEKRLRETWWTIHSWKDSETEIAGVIKQWTWCAWNSANDHQESTIYLLISAAMTPAIEVDGPSRLRSPIANSAYIS